MGFLKGGRGGGLWRSLKGFSLFPSPLAQELQKMKVTEQLLFTFNTQEDLNKWRFSSDARFGGCTTGRFFLTDANTARLEGTLSQEIKPGSKLVESGFATILPVKNMRDIFLDGFDSVEVRLKTDGREWAMNMQCYEQSEDGFFQIYFTTPKDQWFTLLLPLARFTLMDESTPIAAFKDIELDRRAKELCSINFQVTKREGPYYAEFDYVKLVNQERRIKQTRFRGQEELFPLA